MRKRLPRRWPGLSLFVCRPDFSTRMPSPSSFAKLRLALLRHRHPLPRDRVAVLEPGRADVARMRCRAAARSVAGEELRRHAALLDPQVEVVAGRRTARRTAPPRPRSPRHARAPARPRRADRRSIKAGSSRGGAWWSFSDPNVRVRKAKPSRCHVASLGHDD